MNTVYPNGQPGGSAPAGLPGWGPGFPTANSKYREIYASFYIKIGDGDYQAYNGTNKMGFWGVATGSGTDRSNDLFFDLRPVNAGSGNPVVVTSLGLGFEQQNNVARDLMNWPDHMISTGRWYHWEINMKLNTLGSANGVFRWWVDGVLVADRSDVEYITSGNTNPFYSYNWNPTYGGGGPPPYKTRSDNVYTALFYVSGKP